MIALFAFGLLVPVATIPVFGVEPEPVEETDPAGLFFKPDGTKMFVIVITKDKVYQYSLSTAWDVSTASYDSKSSVVHSEDEYPTAVFFKPDGTKMFILGSGNDTVFQYSLSTAWEVSTASYDSKSFNVNSEDTNPGGLFFKDDGTKMFVSGQSGSVHEYSLSTAWDVSTASLTTSFDTSIEETNPAGLFFGNSGAKMYVLGNGQLKVFEYSLSTAWDASTTSYSSNSFSVSTKDITPGGVFFQDDGTKMFTTGKQYDKVYEWALSTAWDVSSASFTTDFNIGPQEPSPDTIPPVVLVPNDVTIQATSNNPSPVTFSVSASDDVDGAITPTCSPTSGSDFPIGATTVTCSLNCHIIWD